MTDETEIVTTNNETPFDEPESEDDYETDYERESDTVKSGYTAKVLAIIGLSVVLVFVVVTALQMIRKQEKEISSKQVNTPAPVIPSGLDYPPDDFEPAPVKVQIVEGDGNNGRE